MNPFERFFSPKKEKDDGHRDYPDQSPEKILPELIDTPEIKRNPNPAVVEKGIRQINEEEKGEYRRKDIIDGIIKERDHKNSQIH